MCRKLFLILSLCGSLSSAHAQSQDVNVPLDRLLNRSQAILKELDDGCEGGVWDEASILMRNSMSKADFIQGIKRDRNDGKVASRSWDSVARAFPAYGNGYAQQEKYLRFVFVGLDRAGGSLKESITFKNEGADNWEMTNYVINRASDK